MTDAEINLLVHTEVMGKRTPIVVCKSGPDKPASITIRPGETIPFHEDISISAIPDYCNSWGAMGEVIEKIDLVFEMARNDNVSYHVKFIEFYHSTEKAYFPYTHKIHSAEAESAPKAVALAALKAIESDQSNPVSESQRDPSDD